MTSTTRNKAGRAANTVRVQRSPSNERLAICSPLDGHLRRAAVEEYATAVVCRLDQHGDHVNCAATQGDLLREVAEELLDVAGWGLVLRYAHRDMSPGTRRALNRAVLLAARAWSLIEAERRAQR